MDFVHFVATPHGSNQAQAFFRALDLFMHRFGKGLEFQTGAMSSHQNSRKECMIYALSAMDQLLHGGYTPAYGAIANLVWQYHEEFYFDPYRFVDLVTPGIREIMNGSNFPNNVWFEDRGDVGDVFITRQKNTPSYVSAPSLPRVKTPSPIPDETLMAAADLAEDAYTRTEAGRFLKRKRDVEKANEEFFKNFPFKFY